MTGRIFFIAFVIVSSVISFGQDAPEDDRISAPFTSKSICNGQIQDPNKIAIPFAGILLYDSVDSTLKAGTTSNEDGSFSFEADYGTYFMKVRFLSYTEHLAANVILDKPIINFGTIVLVPNDSTLSTVFVEADRPEMELKLDKRVFNIQQDMSNAGKNAADILDNIPSVSVDAEGNLSLRGSGNVRILIDGKPSTLVGLSSNDALRQIQGDMIERIEVITNPSARYDAEGEVGIINIVLKKEFEKGFNGSFSLNAGYPANLGAGLNLNLRSKKVNLFGGYTVNYNRGPGIASQTQTYDGPDTVYRYEQESEFDRGGLSHSFRAGVDFRITKKTSLTLSGLYSMSDGDNFSDIVYSDYDLYDSISREVTRKEVEIDNDDRQEYSLNFRQAFNKPEQLFTFDLKKNFSVEGELSDLTQLSSSAADLPRYQRTSADEGEDSWLIQSDYIHPFGKEGKFETGAKISLRELYNDYTLEDSAAGNWAVNEMFDNYLIYTENIYAGYVMMGNKTGKFSYQGGLRMEYSDVTTELVETAEVNRRKYLNFFPSAHLSYELKEKNFIQFSYSRRISRPRYHWLSPFFSFSDSRNYFSGNPNLNPEYTNAFELGHLKYWKKGSLLSSLYYRYSTGITERILFTDSVGFTRRYPVNLGIENSFGFEFSGSYELLKWWDINASCNFYREIMSGDYDSVHYAYDTYAFTGRIRSKFTFSRKFSSQISFEYDSPQATSQGRSKAQYDLGASAALEILKGNGTLSFNVSDIFNSDKRRSIVETEYFYSESSWLWRKRQFRLSFVYRINQKKDSGRDFGNEYEGGGEM